MPETDLRTRLAKEIAGGEYGAAVPIVADGEYGVLETVLLAASAASPAGVQRFFMIVRNTTLGRQTSYYFDVPLERSAEAGARVYKDRAI